MGDVKVVRRGAFSLAAVGAVLALVVGSIGDKATAASQAPKATAKAENSAQDADLRELSNYKLSMAAVNKYAQAARSLKRLEKEQPDLALDEGEDEDDDAADSDSIDSMAAHLQSIPQARAAIEAAGLSTREFVVIPLALFQAGMAQYAIEQGADPKKVMADAHIHPANIDFIKKHKAELEALKPAADAE